MRRALAASAVLALAIAILATSAGGRAGTPQKSFFGIVPQTELTDTDARYMSAGGIGTIRVPVMWSLIQPTAKSGYDWTGFDRAVEVSARRGLTLLPFLYSTPHWVAAKPTTLPVDNGRARRAWVAFVKAAVKRYGPGGEFWAEHAPGGVAAVEYTPAIPRPMPIRTWQVWNEANFFYFALPVSTSRYARLLKPTYSAIKSVDRGAEVVLSGLFGDPNEGGTRGMDAVDFLDSLYRVPGIKRYFDAVALHPYAFHVDDLEALTEETREVVLDNRDPSAALYITEMGWGSQNDPEVVAFEQGIKGQVRELRKSYSYLIGNRHRLNLKGTYWYSWKDIKGYCDFCDSVGLFHEGTRFKPKPAWHAFVALSGGRARP